MTDPQQATGPIAVSATADDATVAAAADGFADAAAVPGSGTTPWRRVTPLRQFLRTETGSAAILAGSAVVALIWVNVSPGSYDSVWATHLRVSVGSMDIQMNLREFVNSGLMAFFFLVVGLEARRELDVGELRARSRLTLPLMAGLAGMIVPAVIFLAFNAGTKNAHGWGTAMSTDTAFALGALALAGKGLPDRVRTFLLTFSVVDDLVALVIIAIAYSGSVSAVPLVFGIAFLAMILLLRLRGVRNGLAYFAFGVAAWIAFFKWAW